jgi:hypothetical protein
MRKAQLFSALSLCIGRLIPDLKISAYVMLVALLKLSFLCRAHRLECGIVREDILNVTCLMRRVPALA